MHDLEPRAPDRGERALLGAAIAAAAVAALLAVSGGWRFAIAGITVSVRDWVRPALLAIVLLAAHAVRLVRQRRPAPLARALEDTAIAGLAVATLLPISLWWYYLVKACGGLDSHGYVSASALLTTGRLTLALPALEWLPFPTAVEAATPLGYVPSLDGQAAVPRFPLGLPVVMAIFRMIAGPNGPFYVAPVLGTALVVLTWKMVRSSYGALTAALAAALVAGHPVFIAYAIQPMSDVPASFWFVLAAFLLGRARPMPLFAGLAAGLAVLTRPTLTVPAAALAALVFHRRREDAARFLVGCVPFIALHAGLSAALYGSPLASGYGGAANLFSSGALIGNVEMYSRLMLDVHTPLFPLLVIAAWFAGDRPRVGAACVVAAAVAVPYMLYALFYDDWETLRFLLPGLVLLLMVAAHGTTTLARRMPRAAAPLLAALVVVVAGAASLSHLRERQVFRLWIAESKYPAVAEAVTRHGDADTVVLAALHSGSVHYYSDRTTVRWDMIPADRLAATIDAIARRGRRMLLVLDGVSEREEFQRRFGANPGGVYIEVIDRVQNVSLASVRPASSTTDVVDRN